MNQPLAIPDHVARLRGARMLAQEGQEGLSGNPVPYVSIKGSRFTAIDAAGNQMPLGAMDQRGLYLDVLIVDLNHAVSKTYYEGAFDPSAQDYKPPTCFSDNGTGPSSRVARPPSMSCASCPMNVWGSKISENGSETKLCNDSKKVALLLADMRVKIPFRLNIPPASLKSWKTHCQVIAGNGADLTMIVTRLRFDPQSSSPILIFEALDWVSPQQADLIEQTLQDDTKLAGLTGRDDVAKTFTATPALTSEQPRAALPQFAPPPPQPAPPPQPQFAPPPVAPAVPPGFGAPPAGAAVQPAPRAPRKPRAPRAAAETPAAPPAPPAGFGQAPPATFGQQPTPGFAPPPPNPPVPPAPATTHFAPPPPAANGGITEPPPNFLRRPPPASAPAGAPPAFGMVQNPPVTDGALDQSIEAALTLRT